MSAEPKEARDAATRLLDMIHRSPSDVTPPLGSAWRDLAANFLSALQQEQQTELVTRIRGEYRRAGAKVREWAVWPNYPVEERDTEARGRPRRTRVARPTPKRQELDALRAQKAELLVEQERLRSELVRAHMDVLAAKQRREQAEEREAEAATHAQDLTRHFERLLELVRELNRANGALQTSLLGQETGRLSMHDVNLGVVVRTVDDEEVAIEFETSDGKRITQVHGRGQFIGHKLPEEGDHVEAHVFAWTSPPKPSGVERYLTPEEIRDGFRGFREAIERRGTE